MKTFLRFIKDLYSGPFQATLVFSFTLVAAVTIGIGTWVISRTVNNYLENAMEERVARDAHLAVTFYEQRLKELADIAVELSMDSAVQVNLDAAIGGDPLARQALQKEMQLEANITPEDGGRCLLILDSSGRIVAAVTYDSQGRQIEAKNTGDWKDLPVVSYALQNAAVVKSTEVIPASHLEQIGVAGQAAITLLETPKAAPQPYDPREGTAGLALFSAAPIFDAGGNLRGLTIVMHLFNNDFTLVDKIRDAAQIDTSTIFLGDLRVSTNVTDENGRRAVGTRLSQEVADVVLREGKEYVGPAFVVTQNYITRYEPLRDHTGQVIGILYVGARQSSFTRLTSALNRQISLVAAITIIMTFILATPISRTITRPLQELRQLVKASQQVAEGDLNARAPIVAGGEVGLVAKSFNSMLDTLQATQEQLVHSEKLASLGQLAAGVAHELNNPLATILLYAETLAKEKPETDPEGGDLKMIISETKRCKRIVSDLLNFARQSQVIAQPTDIHAIFQELLDLAPRRIKTVDVNFVTEFDPDLPVIEGDPTQLRQVFLNLLTNAVEAMPQGGTVTIRTRKEPAGMVAIEIEDTGIGIPPENIGKLFTPFFTTKPIGKGTGLGLAIVYGIIKMHRGQINVKSKINHGTTFIITLPTRLPPLEQNPAKDMTETLTGKSLIG